MMLIIFFYACILMMCFILTVFSPSSIQRCDGGWFDVRLSATNIHHAQLIHQHYCVSVRNPTSYTPLHHHPRLPRLALRVCADQRHRWQNCTATTRCNATPRPLPLLFLHGGTVDSVRVRRRWHFRRGAVALCRQCTLANKQATWLGLGRK